MKKRILLWSLFSIVLFIGGFATGILYTFNKSISTQLVEHPLPSSSKEPNMKKKMEIQKQPAKLLIGYVQDFRDPNQIDYSNLTHVIFSFVHPTKEGGVLFSGDYALNNLRAMVTNAHHYNKKAVLAIGGWSHIKGGESYQYFKPAISNPVTRKKLVTELIRITTTEKLDGIDIDFEHPRNQDDARNLTYFIHDLGDQLHKNKKELSIAVNAKIHSTAGTELNNVVYNPTMFRYVDHVNIMAYDGQWDGQYNAANLSPYTYTLNIVNYWTNLFDQQHLSREKLVLGVPLYAQPTDPNQKQVSYDGVIQKNPSNQDHDKAEINGITYFYNGKTTIQKKTKLTLEYDLGGMMLWEVGLDSKGKSSISNVISQVYSNSNLYVQNK